MSETQRKGGLWAYSGGKFYSLEIEPDDRKTDHPTWFRDLGLPDLGPEYDRIIRGRFTWDWRFNHYVLSYYGNMSLPNIVYDRVIRDFEAEDAEIIEKPIECYWA